MTHWQLKISEQAYFQYCGTGQSLMDVKYLVCKYEEMQRFHGHPNPVDCKAYPIEAPRLCDDCDSIMIDCIQNCGADAFCISGCNREHIVCLDNCE